MHNRFIDLTLSMSSSSCDKNEIIGGHFRWDSIKKFVYVAYAFSSTSTSFDIFSKVLVVHAHLFEYIFYAIFIGVSYMFMDFFIKQYIRKLDTNEALNPLMRGVSFAILLQTALWSILHASDLADSIRFFIASIGKTPSWSKCQKVDKNVTCTNPQDIYLHCRKNIILDLHSTSAHLNYLKMFSNYDRNSMSIRLFVIGTVWICNFFIATMTDNGLLKLFKFSFLWGVFSTAFILIFLLLSTEHTMEAFYNLMNIKDFLHVNNFNLITDPFGVGLIGVYDFGTMSPFTMVDNAILIFTIIFICTAFIRSLIVQVLYLTVKHCVDVNIVDTPHYLLFAILPLSTEFMDAHKIFVLYIYSYLSAALVACLAMFTATTSRILHSLYHSLKNIYIVGLLCFLGFILSMPLIALSSDAKIGLLYGLNICTLCLGALKVAIVMWIYGVKKFSTDIHFWLGFKPTQFWRYIWAVLPFYILVLGCGKFVNVLHLKDTSQKIAAMSWIALTFVILIISQARVLIKYFFKNNIAGIFKSDFKYGPPDADDRKRRRIFDEIIQSRQCRHDCLLLDEKYECNHLPLMYMTKSNLTDSESSLANIYIESSKKKPSSVIDVSVFQNN